MVTAARVARDADDRGESGGDGSAARLREPAVRGRECDGAAGICLEGAVDCDDTIGDPPADDVCIQIFPTPPECADPDAPVSNEPSLVDPTSKPRATFNAMPARVREGRRWDSPSRTCARLAREAKTAITVVERRSSSSGRTPAWASRSRTSPARRSSRPATGHPGGERRSVRVPHGHGSRAVLVE